MKRLSCLLLIVLASTAVFVGNPSEVSAQPGIYVSQEARRAATDVVNGRVVSTTSVMVNGDAHRVSEVEISDNDTGQVTGSILVEVPGGERPDGTVVYVSHTPALIAGELVQLAVAPAEPTVAAVAPVATRRQLPVYSVVRGTEGAYGLSADGISRGEAVGDYALTGASWPDFAPPVGFWVNPSNSGLSDDDAIAGARRAFDLWENDLASNIDFAYQGRTNKRGVSLGDNQTVISWVSSSAGWLAQASWIASASGDIISFDVQINTAYSWSNGASGGRFDIGTVVGHEVGHGLGFSHAPASSELMYFQIISGRVKGLGPGDRAGIAHLYPDPNYGKVKEPGHTVAANSAGHVVKVAMRADGRLLASRDLGGGFSEWVELGAGEWASADVAIGDDGTAHVVAVKQNGLMYTRRWGGGGQWDDWVDHGGGWEPGSKPSIASNGSRTFLGAITLSDQLKTATWQGAWSGFTEHGAATWAHVDVDIAPDGDLWWLAVKNDGRLYARKHLGAGWSGYAIQGKATWSNETSPAISAGSVDIVYSAVKSDGRLYVRRQVAGAWQPYERQGVVGWASVDVSMDGSGTIWLAAHKDWGRLYTRERVASGWRGWQQHGQDTWSPPADASITVGADGRAMFFSVKSFAVAYTRTETASGWGEFTQQDGAVWAPGS